MGVKKVPWTSVSHYGRIDAVKDKLKFGKFELYCDLIPAEPQGRICQDSLGVAFREDQAVFAVSDGMGGHKNGAWASETVIKRIVHYLPTDKRLNLTMLLNRIQKAHNEILSQGEGGGATIALAFINKSDCRLITAGDSKAHVYRQKSVILQANEHNVKWHLQATERAVDSDFGHELTNVIGHDPLYFEVSQNLKLKHGDVISLASDGLDLFPVDIARDIVCSHSPSETLSHQFLKLPSSQHKNRDDIASIVARW